MVWIVRKALCKANIVPLNRIEIAEYLKTSISIRFVSLIDFRSSFRAYLLNSGLLTIFNIANIQLHVQSQILEGHGF